MHDYAPNHSYPSSNETRLEPTLLGEGAQFRVYTDGPGRVRKIPQDASVTYARVASCTQTESHNKHAMKRKK